MPNAVNENENRLISERADQHRMTEVITVLDTLVFKANDCCCTYTLSERITHVDLIDLYTML